MRDSLLKRKPLIWGGGGLLLIIVVLTAAQRRDDGNELPILTDIRNDPGYVSQEKLGQEWPFTVTEGCVQCAGHIAVVFRFDGKTYALNSNALARNYLPITEILKPGYTPSKRDSLLAPILKKGLELCKDR